MPPYDVKARVSVTHEALVEIKTLVSLGYIDNAVDALASLLHQGLDSIIWSHMNMLSDNSEVGTKIRNGALASVSGLVKKNAISNISSFIDSLPKEELGCLRELIKPFNDYYSSDGLKPSHSFVFDEITDAMYAYPDYPFAIIKFLDNVLIFLS